MGNRIVLIGAEDEYHSPETMPALAKELEAQHGMSCKVLADKNNVSNWKPESGKRINELQGIEALNDADLLVLFMRFRTINEDQCQVLHNYLDTGKPIVGFRTSTHSFNYHKDDPLAHWNLFGAQVLGAPWETHYGHKSSTDVSIVPEEANHPILTGVDKQFHVRSWLYKTRPNYPPFGARALLMGKAVDPDKPAIESPVAWTMTHPGGGRVFTTTLGGAGPEVKPSDFEVPAVRRLVINGIHWALGKDPPVRR